MEGDASVAPWLLTGVGGVLGWGLAQHPPAHVFAIGGRQRPSFWPHAPGVCFDLSAVGSFADALKQLRPGVVVHAACMARAEDCAQHRQLAERINVEAVAEWLQTAQEWGSFPIYISSDQVFAGTEDFYEEQSATNPQSFYGQTKARAEELVLAAGGAVVRLPLLLGPVLSATRGGADGRLLAAFKVGSQLKLFHDEWRTPIAAAELGPPLWQIAARRLPGIFHLVGSEAVTRLGLGEQVAAACHLPTSFVPASAAEFAGPPRSLRLCLRCQSTEEALGWKAPNLRQSLGWTLPSPSMETSASCQES